MTLIVTSEGDMLDELCWRHLGTSAVVPDVLEANPGLATQGPIYPAGLRIALPAAAPASVQRRGDIRLWGRT